MKTELTLTDQHPVKWPEGWVRTRIADQKTQSAWKKTMLQYRDALEKELSKLGATSALLTFGQRMGNAEPRDPGVALYFSRKLQEDYSWQEVLGIDNPLPTLDEIDSAFRKVAMQHHPDRGGDAIIFNNFLEHRKRAKEWVLGTHENEHEYVIACDLFREVRWNVCAIRLTLASIRQIERCGASSLLERAFKGFSAALPAHATVEKAS